MSSRRILVLVVAVALAGVAAFSTYNYVSTADERATQDAELVAIWRVEQLIPRGLTFGEARAGGYLGEGRIPAADYPTGNAIVEGQFAEIQDKVALIDIPAGQLLVGGLFVDREATQVSFSDRLEERDGMVAVSFAVDQTRGVAGFIVPGDRINIMVTAPPSDAAEAGTSGADALPEAGVLSEGETPTGGELHLLQYVEVLAVGNEVQLAMGETDDTADDEIGATNTGIITVALRSEDAARVAFAVHSNFDLYLTLLPPDYIPEPVAEITAENLRDAVLPTPGSPTTTVAAVSGDTED